MRSRFLSCLGACPFRKPVSTPEQVRGRLFPGHTLAIALEVSMAWPMSRATLLPVLTTALLCSAAPTNAQDFPDGPGKETFTQVCGACHDINRARAGYTPEGWRTVVQMMKNVDAPVPAGQWDTLTDYLIKSFP